MGDGSVRVGDFGAARQLENPSSIAQTMVGTPYYLAPELIMSKGYQYKADIWSLGILLFEMCALKYPYEQDNISLLSQSIVQDDAPYD